MIDWDALLTWARGPGFSLALAVFGFGVVLRLAEILLLGRKRDFAPAAGFAPWAGLGNIWRRFLPTPGGLRQSPVVHVGGYVFHLGLFVIVFWAAPHILVWKRLTGLSWTALAPGLIDVATLAGLLALLALLAARLFDPVKRLLSGPEDYVTWAVTFLPLLTGWMAVNHVSGHYERLLALHILSVELLLVVFPFTRLMHAITFVFARYASGAISGRKGAHW